MVELNPPASLSLESTSSLKQTGIRLWQWATRPVVFLTLFLLLFGLARWPAMRYDSELNVDESLWMSAAMRYEQDLVPWRSANTNTSGPLELAALLFAEQGVWSTELFDDACGVLSPARVVSDPAVAGALEFIYSENRGTWSVDHRAFSDLGAGEGFRALLFRGDPDVSLFTGAVVLYQGLARQGRPNRGGGHSLAALLAGACPWAKLQSAPMSLCFFAGLCWMTVWPPGSRSARWPGLSRLLMLAAGFMATTVAFLAIVIAAGVWQDFWISYIERNLSYADGGGFLALYGPGGRPLAGRRSAADLPAGHGPYRCLVGAGLGQSSMDFAMASRNIVLSWHFHSCTGLPPCMR